MRINSHSAAVASLLGLSALALAAALAWQAPPDSPFEAYADDRMLPPAQDAKVALGKALFFNARLSEPDGQSCSSCHAPGAGFADPDQRIPTSEGVMPRRFGARNTPTAAYAAFVPPFHFDPNQQKWIGGQFLDGRALDLVEQAQAPFVNPIEMHNESKYLVVRDVARQDRLAELFRYVYGPDSLDPEHADEAYVNIADAIAAFERSPEVNRFSSRFDAYFRGEGELTSIELSGLAIFNGRGNCSSCHTMELQDGAPLPLLTNHTYANIGTPRNPRNPFYFMPPGINPDGEIFIDLGLYNTVLPLDPAHADLEAGKFRVPTLRNVELTAPYGHNGVFKTLKEVVHFYNTRDVASEGWAPPEVAANMDTTNMGNLGLSEAEERALVAFLKTFTDQP